MRSLLLGATAALLSACTVAEPPMPDHDAFATPDGAYEYLMSLDEEAVAEAAAADLLLPEEWCVLKCAAVLYIGCATVGGICLTTDVLTVGAVSIPCAWAIGVACVGIAGGGLAGCIAACT